MLGTKYYYTATGHNTELSEEEYNIGVGCIEIDNDYDTTYSCYLSDCDEKELQAIVNHVGYVNSDIMDYAKDQLGIEDEIEEDQE